MAILDSQGRVFGKVSILDVGAALIILFVIAGIFLFPGSSGSVAQLGVQNKPVEVDVMVRGLTVADPPGLLSSIQEAGKTNIIIRNQPYGQIDVKGVRELPRTVAAPQPDGSLKALPDPRPELDLTIDMLITLSGDAQIVDNGPVLGNNKIKIGTPLELEGLTYRFNTSVVGVRILE
jgi:Domain of unknown function (DUF4330)